MQVEESVLSENYKLTKQNHNLMEAINEIQKLAKETLRINNMNTKQFIKYLREAKHGTAK